MGKSAAKAIAMRECIVRSEDSDERTMEMSKRLAARGRGGKWEVRRLRDEALYIHPIYHLIECMDLGSAGPPRRR